MRPRDRHAGFTLIEILVVVLIIGIISLGVLLSVTLTGRDHELETESDRLLGLVNYAREQAELQTREYGLIFHQDGYQFLAYDARRARWREVYEDEALRQRKLPDGLDVALIVEARPIVLVPTDQASPQPKEPQKKIKSLKDVTTLQDALSASQGTDPSDSLKDEKPLTPQVMIFSNGDLTSFEVTVERDGGARSITLSQDEKGQVTSKPMVERRT
jgi:general secretion pathway protein H